MMITKKNQLQKIRAEVQDSLYAPALLKMNVGMATCGIAAGAKDVYDKAREIFTEQDLLVARTGCLGLCEEEPLVDIQAPGQPRIVYRRVSADKVMELVEAHQKAEYLEKAILGQMKDPRSILEDDIDKTFIRANGVSPYDYALQHTVRITFQDTPVHVSAGVALVRIADNVSFLPVSLTTGCPFYPGGKAASTPSPEPRDFDSLDNLFRLHFMQGMEGCEVAASPYILFNAFRVDVTAIPQGYLELFAIKRNFFQGWHSVG